MDLSERGPLEPKAMRLDGGRRAVPLRRQLNGNPKSRPGNAEEAQRMEVSCDSPSGGVAAQEESHHTDAYVEPGEMNDGSTAYQPCYYNMDHEKRGVVLIFNHRTYCKDLNKEERRGTDIDCRRLFNLFEGRGFEVTLNHDFSKSKIRKEIQKFRKRDYSNHDCLFVFVLTHGDENGVLYSVDSVYRRELELWAHFTGDKCPSLAGKPKLFFIQACQGVEAMESCKTSEVCTDGGKRRQSTLPTHADILVGSSTIPNFVSFRLPKHGSIYIQTLCNVFENMAMEHDLLTMLTTVNDRVSKTVALSSSNPKIHLKKQMPCFTSMLVKLVKFQWGQATLEARLAALDLRTETQAPLDEQDFEVDGSGARELSRRPEKPSSIPVREKVVALLGVNWNKNVKLSLEKLRGNGLLLEEVEIFNFDRKLLSPLRDMLNLKRIAIFRNDSEPYHNNRPRGESDQHYLELDLLKDDILFMFRTPEQWMSQLYEVQELRLWLKNNTNPRSSSSSKRLKSAVYPWVHGGLQKILGKWKEENAEQNNKSVQSQSGVAECNGPPAELWEILKNVKRLVLRTPHKHGSDDCATSRKVAKRMLPDAAIVVCEVWGDRKGTYECLYTHPTSP